MDQKSFGADLSRPFGVVQHRACGGGSPSYPPLPRRVLQREAGNCICEEYGTAAPVLILGRLHGESRGGRGIPNSILFGIERRGYVVAAE